MADAESPLGMIQLAATSFYVSDIDAAVAWYDEKFGLQPAMAGVDGHRYASFVLGGSFVVLEPREAALEPADPGPETTTVNLIVDRDPRRGPRGASSAEGSPVASWSLRPTTCRSSCATSTATAST